mmetsp:Transcript_60945/g.108275  ORF Transcript_60945/g.108275 Transcript_60945/m.108275 type:complete len:964 (-) Transcript_60945:79-2970(-)|eukprot:CAMPEP_0197663128 /NCGR_PEP_ID=MMETSP1338-20131121/56163_1 /TAXON_ID=43686 ORGANISM="Pelagodinium beii, Strain RCC1491" /NCGR_SAMPLE_ID=MMETSP1338 /ASSEMBLY_ACC=CAM_ASM_000754 /LENGTH=963 /DNA_ID=CAMNT_0043241339 /DNA_START=32 /DNA_END=2923 /DNA_ORIENTATION=+
MAKAGLPRLHLDTIGAHDKLAARIPAGTISKFLDENEDNFDIRSWHREYASELNKVALSSAAQGNVQQSSSTTSFQSLASGTSSKGFASSLPPLLAREAESGLGSEERVSISQAIYSPHDSLHYHVCRGNLNSILELRECCALQSARDRLKLFDEVGIEHRRKAHEWGEKEQRRQAKAQEKDEGVSSPQSARPKVMNSADNASSASLVKAFTKGKLSVEKEEPPSTPPKRLSVRKSVLSRKSVTDMPKKKVSVAFQTFPPGLDEDLQDLQDELRSKGMTLSDDMRAQIWARGEQRTTQAAKNGDEKTKDKYMDSEREVLHKVFSYYCNDGETMALTNLIRCLMELGLAGATYHERLTVEKLLTKVYDSLVQEQGPEALQVSKLDPRVKGRGQEAWDAGSKNGGIFRVLFPRDLVKEDEEGTSRDKFPEQPYATLAQALLELDKRAETLGAARSPWTGKLDVINILRLVPVCFDDFVAEIVPMMRQQLNEMRLDRHLQLFLKELHNKSSQISGNMLSSAQFINAGTSIGLDREETSEVVHDALAALKSRKARLDKCWIDRESFHELMLFVEERCARKQHSLERQIMKEMKLSENEFWRFRTHLATVKGLMQSLTGKDLALQRVEVMQLFKQMGFQPYHAKQHDMVQDCLDVVHTNDVVPFTFKETLQVADLIRSRQKTARSEKLWRCFQQMKPSGRTTMPLHLVENILFDPLLELNLRITSVKEQGALKRAIDETETASPGDVNFQELEDLCQKTFEVMHGNTARESFQRARVEGLSLDMFSDYQQLFDKYDANCSGTLEIDEVREALRLKMGKSVTAADVQKIYSTKGLNIDLPLQIWDFLRLMDASIALSKPFTVRDLALSRLRECLGFFPVRLDGIINLPEHELPALVASYLGFDASTNLKELPEKIASAEQLVHYARVKGRQYREQHVKVHRGQELLSPSSSASHGLGCSAAGSTSSIVP